MKPLKGLLTALLLLVAPLVWALPPPAPTERITDLSSVLNANAKQQLASELKALEAKNGSQIIVYITKTTGGEAMEQFTHETARAWKIGQAGNNNGAILFIFTGDKKMRIEVGTGLEGALPDIVCKRVLSEIIRPKLKQGDYNNGVVEGTRALIRLASGEKFEAVKPQGMSTTVMLLCILGGVLVLAWIVIKFGSSTGSGGYYSSGSSFGSSSSHNSSSGGGGDFSGGGSSDDW